MADKITSDLFPLIRLKGQTIIPNTIAELNTNNAELIAAIDTVMEQFNGHLVIMNEPVKIEGFKTYTEEHGVVAKVIRIDKTDTETLIILHAKQRVGITSTRNIKSVPIEELVTFTLIKRQSASSKALTEARNLIQSFISKVEHLPFEFSTEEVDEYAKLNHTDFIDSVADLIPFENEIRREYVQLQTLYERYIYITARINDLIKKEFEPNENNPEEIVKAKVKQRVSAKISKQQKEFYLREQIRAAQAELDEINGEINEVDTLRKRVEKNPYPKHIKEKLLKEIRKLEQTPSQAQEANITRGYIE